jgi:hypothetical protein
MLKDRVMHNEGQMWLCPGVVAADVLRHLHLGLFFWQLFPEFGTVLQTGMPYAKYLRILRDHHLIYYNDHVPPHFHAEYAEHEALFRIATLEVYQGELPRRAHALVLEWAALRRAELLANWERARQGVPLQPIEPMDGFKVPLTFTDGTEKDIDLGPYLRGPVFETIRRDQMVFRSMKVDQRMGTIIWPNGADIDPDVLVHGLQPAWMYSEPALHH